MFVVLSPEADLSTTPDITKARPAGDIATIAVFLASDDSGWLSGERIIAAGGSR